VTEYNAIDVALDEDFELMEAWHKASFDWRKSVNPLTRKRRVIRRRIIETTRQQLESGERDQDKIVEAVYGNLIVLMVILPIVQELVKLFVRKIIELWEEREQ
jgi:hypothetical protein